MSLFKFSSELKNQRSASGKSRPGSHRRRGASVIVETFFCMTLVLLPLSIGTLQFGVVMSTSNQLEQVSREGARWSAVHASDANFQANESTQGSLRYYLKNLVVAQRTAILWTDISGDPRPIIGGTNPTPSGTTPAGFVQVIFANGIPNGSTSPAPPIAGDPKVLGSPVSGQSVSVRVVYPMTRKVFTGRITPNVGVLDNDYVSTSTFVVE